MRRTNIGIVILALMSASSAHAVDASALGSNLVADPGFESGVSGFAASSGDQAVRVTTNPISGTASLAVTLKSVGSVVSWSQSMPAATNSSMLTIMAKVRPDTISQWSTLHLCAEAVYSDELGTLQKCVPVSTVPGAVNALTVEMPLDASKSVANVTLQVVLRSATAVVFDMDDVSVVLTAGSP